MDNEHILEKVSIDLAFQSAIKALVRKANRAVPGKLRFETEPCLATERSATLIWDFKDKKPGQVVGMYKAQVKIRIPPMPVGRVSNPEAEASLVFINALRAIWNEMIQTIGGLASGKIKEDGTKVPDSKDQPASGRIIVPR